MISQAFSDPIALDQVRTFRARRKTMTDQDFLAVVHAALDTNRVSRRASVRAEWCRILDEVSQRTSGRCPDAAEVGPDNDVWGVDKLSLRTRRGLFGMSPDEFREHHMPGTSYNIYDSVSNTAAFIHSRITGLNLNPNDAGLLADYRLSILRSVSIPTIRGVGMSDYRPVAGY